jgi:uncharacterized repeat protein (TIGR02543 family)
MGGTDSSWRFSGWNIDDVAISGLSSYVNPAGEVAFSAATYNVAEDGGSAIITVDRSGGTVGAISVDYSTSDGTATDGSDFSATSGTLSWANGDGTSKTFGVPITNDSDHEDFIESIDLILTNTVGATIVDPNSATLNIEDDDNNPPSVDAGEDQTVEWQTVTTTPGLYYGAVSGAVIDISTPNPETEILIDVSSKTEDAIAGNTTEIYTGNIYDADGQISFTEHIDDNTRIWIDDVLVLSDDVWGTRASTANLNLAPGWHTIEIRIFNGAGGSGPVSAPGIGYDPAGGTAWQTLVDPGDGSFLKANQNVSGADANLDGTVSDLDGDPVTTSWSVVSGPGSVAFDDASAVDIPARFGAIGIYTLRLTADDGREQSTDDVVISVGFTGIILEIDAASISENGGTSNASVSRFASIGDLVVNLGSDDATEATVPASVTILDGQTSANFTITAQDDAVVDGSQTVTITATSVGNSDATDTIDITDDEVAVLTINIVAASVGESDGTSATTATVTRNTDTTSEMVVNLSSSDSSEADVQATVTIAAGQTTSPVFDIDAIDDASVDGTQSVTITASYVGHADGTDTLDVTDDASISLTLVTGSGGASTSGGGLKDPDGSPYAISASASTNYAFVNWTVTSGSATVDDENAPNTFVIASADATIQANFALATYTVSYDGNTNTGGSAPLDQEKTHGQDLTLSGQGDLTKTGYSFGGWNTEVNGSGDAYTAGGTYNVDAAVTLYAQWAPQSYTVTFDSNGGNAPSPTSKSVTFDAGYGTLASTDRADYIFVGWFTQASGGTKIEAGTTVTTAAAHTLYAQWLLSTPPVISSVDPADNTTGVAADSDLTVTFDEDITVATGNITIKNLTDASNTVIDVTDGTQVSTSGAVLTINPTVDLDLSKNYAVQIDVGAVTDLIGSPFAGITDDTTWNFQTVVEVVIFSESFENPDVINDGSTDPVGWVQTNHPGYVHISDENDTSKDFTSTPYGEQALTCYHGGGATATTTSTILNEVVAADTLYKLSFHVSAAPGRPKADYVVTLLAIDGSGVETVLGSVTGANDGSSDMSYTDLLEVTTTTANVDERIAIRLQHNTATAWQDKPNFDNVQLKISGGAVSYSVTYNANGSDGGTVPVDGAEYSLDGSVTVLGNTGSLVKAGDNFAGWNTASDGSGTSYVADDTFTITEDITLYAQWTLNNAPVADDQSVDTGANTAVAITLTASDADGNTLTYTVATQPTNGALSGTAPGLTYTPNTSYSGGDSFTFTANDGNADSNTATVSITVQTPFEGWTGGAASSPTVDSSGDGIPDGLAWVLGASDPSSDAAALLPNSDMVSDFDYFIFTYRRSDVAYNDSDTSIEVIYSNDLSSWTTAVHDGTNVVITETDDYYGPGVDRVEVKLNWDLAADEKIFTRVRVEIAP